jgi:hypothetical protein
VLLSGGAALAQATDMGPPPVLVIQREFVKPGKSGLVHEKSESAYVAAMRAAKWPTPYLAMTSMSGRPRALFMLGYGSFADWEKDNKAMEKNATLSAALDKLGVIDGDLLTEFNQSVFTYDAEYSLRTHDVVHDRYFEISQYHIKPGHRAEWIELMKMYKDGYGKAGTPLANWAVYESYYGEDNGGLYLSISAMKTLAEDDQTMGDGKKFSDAIGADGMKKVRELTAACIESVQTNLFEFSPKMSYASEDWIKADPFWKPKAPAAAKPTAPAAQ